MEPLTTVQGIEAEIGAARRRLQALVERIEQGTQQLGAWVLRFGKEAPSVEIERPDGSVLHRTSILEKSRAWVCPDCGTRYPGEQDSCLVCIVLADGETPW